MAKRIDHENLEFDYSEVKDTLTAVSSFFRVPPQQIRKHEAENTFILDLRNNHYGQEVYKQIMEFGNTPDGKFDFEQEIIVFHNGKNIQAV